MLQKTRAIILHYIKYTDSSVIVHAYTEKFGRLSLMVNGINSKKANIKLNQLQSLLIHEIDFYYKANRDIQRLKELRNILPFSSIPYDMGKRSIALFMSEILYKTLKEEEAHQTLFDFLVTSIEMLDQGCYKTGWFHMRFLVQLTKYLGFFPRNNFIEEQKEYFDLQNGTFTENVPSHPFVLHPPISKFFSHLISYANNEKGCPSVDLIYKKELMHGLVDYFKIHFDSIKEIRSLDILEEVFQQ